ncbi:MAG: AmmeMemoRadiSam system protein A [Polyangiaceae bacterium]
MTALPPEDALLPGYARGVIRAALGGPKTPRPAGPSFDRRAAAFVTLRWPDGTLQGCIGTIEPRAPLADAVAGAARSAAFQDPRGRPLHLPDADALFIEVSVLSPTEPIPCTDEPSARAALRPGKDGVVLRCRGHQGTFLPQMWPRLGDPATFLTELKRKAGLPADYWSPDIELLRYTVETHTDGQEPPEEHD